MLGEFEMQECERLWSAEVISQTMPLPEDVQDLEGGLDAVHHARDLVEGRAGRAIGK